MVNLRDLYCLEGAVGIVVVLGLLNGMEKLGLCYFNFSLADSLGI